VLRKSEASCKSNIRSYGVFLLELLTGKSIVGEEFLNDEKLFTRWAKPYLGDQEQLASIIDPHLRRQFPCPGLKKVAALTLQCLRKDPNKRPSISEVVDILDTAMVLQPARRTPNRSMNKCMSLRRFQPPAVKGFSRTFSNKQF
jgi:serine/threonine protein kinase